MPTSSVIETKEQRRALDTQQAAQKPTAEIWIEAIVAGLVMAALVYVGMKYGFKVQDDMTKAGAWIAATGAFTQTLLTNIVMRRSARKKSNEGKL